MYLKNGREIYESDQYPGYYIDSNTGNFCDESGNYIGGNIDLGDKPGRRLFTDEYVWVSKSGKQYYPSPTKSAIIRLSKMDALRKGYRASAMYKNKKK